MRTKHTPAPWNFGQKHYDQVTETYSVYDSKGNLIHAGLSPRSYDHITKETAEANAKLIATSPLMLETLVKALEQLDNGFAVEAGMIQEAINKATL